MELKLLLPVVGLTPSKLSLKTTESATELELLAILAVTLKVCCCKTLAGCVCVAVSAGGVGKMLPPSCSTATSLQNPGLPGSGPYTGVGSTWHTAVEAMLPKISPVLSDMVIAVETMTRMNGGSVAGGKLLPGFELQQLSSNGPPLPALTSQTFTWLPGSAKPLKLGFAVNAVKLPAVTWFVQEWPQKFTSCP